jgi:diacylglycerol kinase family enzyme
MSATLRAIEEAWAEKGASVSYQFSNSVEDGVAKARAAIRAGVDALVVVGGDGMVNTIGAELVGSKVAFGVIPAGSGNGFARHFNIPLSPASAARALASAERKKIDVGTANGRPFFVTCSLAWDAALVTHFEKSPIRGILPYVFAGAQGILEYQPQNFQALLDGSEELQFTEPIVFTIANLTQFGGGARIAPHADASDGFLELVVVERAGLPKVLLELPRLFNGTIDSLSEVTTRRFRKLHVMRPRAAEMQLDGEVVGAPAEVEIGLVERGLTVLVPRKTSPA